MEFLKSITGKVVAGIVALAVIAGAISWWQMDVASRDALLNNTGKLLAWLGVVLLLPWVSFFVIGRIAKLESNAAGAALIAVYTIAELVLLAWLFDWSITGPGAWTFFLLGGLLAGAYNLLTCDWIAEKVE